VSFLVWKPRSRSYEKFYNSDEELSELAKIYDEELEMAIMHKNTAMNSPQNVKNIHSFLGEIEELLLKTQKANTDTSNLVLEIMDRKQKYNIQIDDFYFYLVKALFELPIHGKSLTLI